MHVKTNMLLPHIKYVDSYTHIHIHMHTHQGCSVRGSVKSSGLRTFTHFNEP